VIARIDAAGGLIAAIRTGLAGQLIADSAWEQQVAIESGDRLVVGVNAFEDEAEAPLPIEPFRLDPGIRERQLARLAEVRRTRDGERLAGCLADLRRAADDPAVNLMPPIEAAVRARGSVGEICNVLREAWGEYRPPAVY
jgi:methylmalonyl-CoA mutase N-terminal domain/subunit